MKEFFCRCVPSIPSVSTLQARIAVYVVMDSAKIQKEAMVV